MKISNYELKNGAWSPNQIDHQIYNDIIHTAFDNLNKNIYHRSSIIKVLFNRNYFLHETTQIFPLQKKGKKLGIELLRNGFINETHIVIEKPQNQNDPSKSFLLLDVKNIQIEKNNYITKSNEIIPQLPQAYNRTKLPIISGKAEQNILKWIQKDMKFRIIINFQQKNCIGLYSSVSNDLFKIKDFIIVQRIKNKNTQGIQKSFHYYIKCLSVKFYKALSKYTFSKKQILKIADEEIFIPEISDEESIRPPELLDKSPGLANYKENSQFSKADTSFYNIDQYQYSEAKSDIQKKKNVFVPTSQLGNGKISKMFNDVFKQFQKSDTLINTTQQNQSELKDLMMIESNNEIQRSEIAQTQQNPSSQMEQAQLTISQQAIQEDSESHQQNNQSQNQIQTTQQQTSLIQKNQNQSTSQKQGSNQLIRQSILNNQMKVLQSLRNSKNLFNLPELPKESDKYILMTLNTIEIFSPSMQQSGKNFIITFEIDYGEDQIEKIHYSKLMLVEIINQEFEYILEEPVFYLNQDKIEEQMRSLERTCVFIQISEMLNKKYEETNPILQVEIPFSRFIQEDNQKEQAQNIWAIMKGEHMEVGNLSMVGGNVSGIQGGFIRLKSNILGNQNHYQYGLINVFSSTINKKKVMQYQSYWDYLLKQNLYQKTLLIKDSLYDFQIKIPDIEPYQIMSYVKLVELINPYFSRDLLTYFQNFSQVEFIQQFSTQVLQNLNTFYKETVTLSRQQLMISGIPLIKFLFYHTGYNGLLRSQTYSSLRNFLWDGFLYKIENPNNKYNEDQKFGQQNTEKQDILLLAREGIPTEKRPYIWMQLFNINGLLRRIYDLFSGFCKRKINGQMIPLLKDRYKLLLDSFFNEKLQHNENVTFIIYQDLYDKREILYSLLLKEGGQQMQSERVKQFYMDFNYMLDSSLQKYYEIIIRIMRTFYFYLSLTSDLQMHFMHNQNIIHILIAILKLLYRTDSNHEEKYKEADCFYIFTGIIDTLLKPYLTSTNRHKKYEIVHSQTSIVNESGNPLKRECMLFLNYLHQTQVWQWSDSEYNILPPYNFYNFYSNNVLTLYSTYFNLEMVYRIWDILLLENKKDRISTNIILLSIAMTIFDNINSLNIQIEKNINTLSSIISLYGQYEMKSERFFQKMYQIIQSKFFHKELNYFTEELELLKQQEIENFMAKTKLGQLRIQQIYIEQMIKQKQLILPSYQEISNKLNQRELYNLEERQFTSQNLSQQFIYISFNSFPLHNFHEDEDSFLKIELTDSDSKTLKEVVYYQYQLKLDHFKITFSTPVEHIKSIKINIQQSSIYETKTYTHKFDLSNYKYDRIYQFLTNFFQIDYDNLYFPSCKTIELSLVISSGSQLRLSQDYQFQIQKMFNKDSFYFQKESVNIFPSTYQSIIENIKQKRKLYKELSSNSEQQNQNQSNQSQLNQTSLSLAHSSLYNIQVSQDSLSFVELMQQTQTINSDDTAYLADFNPQYVPSIITAWKQNFELDQAKTTQFLQYLFDYIPQTDFSILCKLYTQPNLKFQSFDLLLYTILTCQTSVKNKFSLIWNLLTEYQTTDNLPFYMVPLIIHEILNYSFPTPIHHILSETYGLTKRTMIPMIVEARVFSLQNQQRSIDVTQFIIDWIKDQGINGIARMALIINQAFFEIFSAYLRQCIEKLHFGLGNYIKLVIISQLENGQYAEARRKFQFLEGGKKMQLFENPQQDYSKDEYIDQSISEQFNKIILFESVDSQQYLYKEEFLYIVSKYPQLSYFITQIEYKLQEFALIYLNSLPQFSVKIYQQQTNRQYQNFDIERPLKLEIKIENAKKSFIIILSNQNQQNQIIKKSEIEQYYYYVPSLSALESIQQIIYRIQYLIKDLNNEELKDLVDLVMKQEPENIKIIEKFEYQVVNKKISLRTLMNEVKSQNDAYIYIWYGEQSRIQDILNEKFVDVQYDNYIETKQMIPYSRDKDTQTHYARMPDNKIFRFKVNNNKSLTRYKALYKLEKENQRYKFAYEQQQQQQQMQQIQSNKSSYVNI